MQSKIVYVAMLDAVAQQLYVYSGTLAHDDDEYKYCRYKFQSP